MRKLFGRLLAAAFKRDERLLDEVAAALGVEETPAVREARQRAYERWRERCAGRRSRRRSQAHVPRGGGAPTAGSGGD